ncbi:GNAT family N-acetyltransferase [Chromobacterium sp. IIBBL 290-4]|uniref:GNAT family N-acetyltransferase n=1 Tax=Chromobacterium sp. IIBBL 290-4 TaxID=2953890 RepID=UPI0020B771F5|nr:GNAT family N-acetyltransferase [Chromobacterium sp. IIBBL 290-4]UTH76009.1 GNAT family N-acetyltransferase [Chromobacterium sp. IIBBL 290-4]
MQAIIDSDPARLERDRIYQYLSQQSYWAKGLPREIFDRSVEHSLCFGAYGEDGRQLGFGRVVTDCATFAYLADIFVWDEYQGHGIGKQLVAGMLAHPKLRDLRRMMLATADAHGLYAQYGFAALSKPERLMERLEQGVYQRLAEEAAAARGD